MTLRERVARLERLAGADGYCGCLDADGYSWERALARLAGTLGPPLDDAGKCTSCGLPRLDFDWTSAFGGNGTENTP